MEIETADNLPEGWRLWRDWHTVIAPDNAVEIRALEADQGRYIGYVRAVGHRLPESQLEEPIVSIPTEYVRKPMLRGEE